MMVTAKATRLNEAALADAPSSPFGELGDPPVDSASSELDASLVNPDEGPPTPMGGRSSVAVVDGDGDSSSVGEDGVSGVLAWLALCENPATPC